MRTIEKNSDYMQMLIGSRLSSAETYKDIKESDWNWIDNGDIRHVCLRLLVIASINNAWIDGICMAKITRRLIGCEVRPGGPYMCDDGRVDLFLNGVIAQLFRQLNISLPLLESFVMDRSKDVRLSVGDTTFLEWILSHPGKLQDDGKVSQKEAFREVFFDARQWFARPRAILAMLTDTSMTRVERVSDKKRPSRAALAVKREINQQYKSNNLHSGMIKQWRLVVKADKNHEISALSSYFIRSVKKENAKLKAQKVELCNMANFYTWMAYSIYDDFLDGSPKREDLLIANTSYRHALSLYCKVAPHSKIHSLFQKTDEANYVEVKHKRCKVKNGFIYIDKSLHYESVDQVAYKSIAHIFGPMTIVASMKLTQAQVKNIEDGLLHYLKARQLNDDMHDWVDDIKHGHISYVVYELLLGLDIKPGKYELNKLIERMKRYYWDRGLVNASGKVLRNIELARDKLDQSNVFLENNSFYKNILNSIETTARSGVVRYSDQIKFFEEYNKRH